MKFDSKVKGGLAWAGLVVILAVPSAEMLTGKPADRAASLTSDLTPVKDLPVKDLSVKTGPVGASDPMETASVETATVEAPVLSDPVEAYVEKNKKLPSYISDGGGIETETPATVKQPVGVKPLVAPTEVASIAPAETPPVPLPRSMRPKATVVASLPAEEPAPIVDETTLPQREAALTPEVEPFPLSDSDQFVNSDQVVTSDELEEWDSGSLADYLAQKGLLSEDTAQAESADNFDPDGFFLDEGPNDQRYIRPAEEWDFF